MQADPSERVQESRDQGGVPMVPIMAGIVVLVILGVWLFGREAPPAAPEPEPIAEAAPAPMPEPLPEPAAPAPDIPTPQPVPAPEPAQPAPPPLALEDSDEPARAMLSPVLGSDLLRTSLQVDNLLERGVAVVDGLSRGAVRHKLLPLAPPQGKFPVRKDAGQAVMDPAGYRRYDAHVEAIEALDTDALVAVFNRFRPLLEEAYGLLGYEPEDFDNALIRGLDQVITAPKLNRPAEVRKVEAVYKFEDPQLERLSELHKQMLRMGPVNTARVQAKAAELREALLAQ